MPWLICGTFPSNETVLLKGRASVKLSAASALRRDDAPTADWPGVPADSLLIHSAEGQGDPAHLPLGRGTPALAGAAALVTAELDAEPPHILIAGDNGKGDGSRELYRHLCEHAAEYSGWGITFHYLLPDVDWHNRILMALEDLPERPTLCADAGFMYAAKMSGYASSYDLFTPDLGELAFLADEKAPHPFYTRGFLLTEEADAAGLIARAYEHQNAARCMLVKGRTDFVTQDGKIVADVHYPMVPHLEPIGGTGDTVAGSASALLSAGYPMQTACILAAMANRFMGQLAQPTPATQISELLGQLPGGLRLALQELE